MCGIAGIAGVGSQPPDRATLERMAARIVHRGPDEAGFLVEPGIGFAFRRLRVIDLHTGSQPQANEDRTVHVVFNGEIYNHAELREGLIARGHRFATHSDTEVLVHLYEEKGVDFVKELNGMFAIALWDSRRSRLVLARDPIGVKPLLYARTEEGLVFGSEMGSLLEASGVDRSLDPTALNLYFSWGAIPAPHTILRGVRRLEPAHLMVWEQGRSEQRRYWHPLDSGAETPSSYESGARQLRDLLADAVRLQRVSDVPLGAFLSGGVDSTTLVGLMAQYKEPVSTFSVGFSQDPVFDETPYARAAARFHQTQHAEQQLGAEDIRAVIPEVLNGITEPFGSSSILPSFVVSRATRRHMTVALSGDGADELFAGYEKYLGETYRSWYGRIPQPLRRRVIARALRAMPASRGSRWGDLGRKTHRFLDGAEGAPDVRHDQWMRIVGAAEIGELLAAPPDADAGLQIIRDLHADYAQRGGSDELNRILFTDFSLALPSDMLMKVDLASMLNSLEVRVPFLDHRIVSLAMSMPGSWKMKGRARKRVLKTAISNLLPPEIRNRPKAGFEVPVGEWLKNDLREMFWDTVLRAGGTPLHRPTLERWYDEHRSGRVERAKILWAVFAFRWWEGNGAGLPEAVSVRPVSEVNPIEVRQ